MPLGRAHLFEASEAQRRLLKPSLDAAALLNATDRYDDQSISGMETRCRFRWSTL